MWAKWTISPTSCHLTHWPYWKKQASVWSLFVSSWPHWQLRGNYDFAPLQEKFLALSFFSSWASSFQHHCAQAKSKNFSVQFGYARWQRQAQATLSPHHFFTSCFSPLLWDESKQSPKRSGCLLIKRYYFCGFIAQPTIRTENDLKI